ncbi:APC family permease [Pseudonocardia parietis]|uniref:Amino acid transporter n=1 Tax=Pseudonocardia parietis TaxID=570936 RepID=A0ABS4VYA0_9PSEU|nr:APC family permease [Pseudonocardia parietis]MBP2368932.1 amino acid transporter [Pseudonocardia parietis]
MGVLRDRSPVHGLMRRRLGPADVVAQSIAGSAPSAAMAATPVIVAGAAGPYTVWAFVAATVLALLVAASIGRFTTRMAAPGGLYTLTAQGLGSAAAFAGGIAGVAGYLLLCGAALAGAALYLGSLLAPFGAGGPWLPAAAALVGGALVTALVVRGVRLAARVVLLVEAVAVAVLVGVFVLLLAGGPLAGAAAPAAPAPGVGGLVAGVLPALAAFIGFEVATSLGAEARRPFRSVPRAVMATAAVTGVLYVFAAGVQVSGFAGVPGGLAAQPQPVQVLATARGWWWIPPVLDAALVLSFLACAVATATALSRVLFSLARDGAVPAVLGRTHRRFRTPHVAVGLGVPVATAAVVVPVLAGVPTGTVLVALLAGATIGFLITYALVCLAAPLFLRRIGELTPAAVLTAVVAVPALLAALAGFVVTVPATGIVLLAALLVAVIWFAVLRRAGGLRDLGVYDETVASDVWDRAA